MLHFSSDLFHFLPLETEYTLIFQLFIPTSGNTGGYAATSQLQEQYWGGQTWSATTYNAFQVLISDFPFVH